jgi:D-inositol-3-phosphate glycosyltransferase
VSGLLVSSHEPADWAAAIDRLLQDDTLRERLAAGALAHAASFSWEHTTDRTLAAYRRAQALAGGALSEVS